MTRGVGVGLGGGKGVRIVTERTRTVRDDGLWADVTLVPVRGGPSARGEARTWDDDGATVRVAFGSALALDGQPVWVRATSTDSHLVLLSARARRGERRDELALDAVVHVATEARRAHLRAPVEHPVLLVQEGTRSRTTRTVDLSAAGCRVRRLPEHRLREGQRLRAALDVDAGPPVWADTEVVRVDHEVDEIALHFLEVADADAERLDRDVLAYLTAEATG